MSLRERLRRILPLRVKAIARAALSLAVRDSTFTARRKASRYLASRGSKPACLHVGCGELVMAEWLNVDLLPRQRTVIAADLRRGLPFLAEESMDFIYHEHFLEHLELRDGRRFLRECHRVLKRGGRMRIAVPDLDAFVRRYLAGEADAEGRFADYRRALHGEPLLDTPGELFNLGMRGWEHRFIYSERDLVRVLELAGFRAIRRVAYGQSDVDGLRGLETRPPDRSNLIVEAEK